MIKLYDSSIDQILPDALRNEETKSIAYAVNQQLCKILHLSNNIGVMAKIDSIPEYLLDLLAIELKTQYYEQTLPIDIKRTLIKTTLTRHEKAGTPAAVEELIGIVFGHGKEIEWYEYGGEPGHFKIETDNQEVAGSAQQNFLQLLENVKRKSAHLDSIEVVTDAIADIHIFLCNSESDIEVSKAVNRL